MVQNDPKFRVCDMSVQRRNVDNGFETVEAAIQHALTLDMRNLYEVYEVSTDETAAIIQLGKVFTLTNVPQKKEEPPTKTTYKVKAEEIYLIRRTVDFDVEVADPGVFALPKWQEQPGVNIRGTTTWDFSERGEYIGEFVMSVDGVDSGLPEGINLPAGIEQGDIISLLEMARLGIAMVGDDIAEEMDISDAELVRLRDLLETLLGEPDRRKRGEGIAEDAPTNWLKRWKKEGDDMPCPQCSKKQVETQDGVTLCRACGWQENNPLSAGDLAALLDERESLRAWVKGLAEQHTLDEGQEVVFALFWDAGTYSLELESDHGTVAGIWDCNTDDEATALVFVDQLDKVLAELGYKVLPEWTDEDDQDNE